jgi:transposase
VLDGILWILRTGALWRDLPERYPPTRSATAASDAGARRYEKRAVNCRAVVIIASPMLWLAS